MWGFDAQVDFAAMRVTERIGEMVKSNEVVLFMKGTRQRPQCGFSATVVDILDDYLEDYVAVNVLEDPAIREGVKEYASWPTIPQLYVKGELVGGSDIVKELRESGELETALGRPPRPFRTPDVTITDAAVSALLKHWEGEGKAVVRLEIDREFNNSLYFDEPKQDDIVMDAEAFTLLMDRNTARRADGLVVDFVRGKKESGFKIDNPNEPPRVKQLSAPDLAKWKEEGKPFHLFDVRTPEERSIAKIEGSILLDTEGRALLEKLDHDETVVLQCHHGVRSQAAAEHLLRMGFRNVFNLAGGIDAWSRDVDPSVPAY